MAVPVPHTWTAGDDATSAAMQTLTDAILYLLGSATSGGAKRPFAQPRQSVAQSLPTTAVWTALTFDAEDVDYDNGHSTVTNTDRYTALTTGWHIVSGGVAFAANAVGRRGIRYTVNGTVVNGSGVVLPTTAALVCAVPGREMAILLNVNDILRVEGMQESGGALNTAVAAEQQPHLLVRLESN